MSAETRGRLLGVTRIVVLMTCLVGAAVRTAAAPITPIPGSPFQFWDGGNSSQIVCLSPDERFLFASNQWGSSVTALSVAPDGTLSSPQVTWLPHYAQPTGMATSSDGKFLYVIGSGSQYAEVFSADQTTGALSPIQSADLGLAGDYTTIQDGIAYVTLDDGSARVYANVGTYMNKVSAFRVLQEEMTLADGTVLPPGALDPNVTFYPTGGYTDYNCLFASPSMVATSADIGRFLYVANNYYYGSSLTTFAVAADGTLSMVGSPTEFSYPGLTGAIAAHPNGRSLYAGTRLGNIAKYTIGDDGGLTLADERCAVDDSWYYTGVDGLAVHPSGDYLIATVPTQNRFAMLDLADMQNLSGCPVYDWGPPLGVKFNAAGTLLFAGESVGDTCVAVYQKGDILSASAPAPIDRECEGPVSVLTLNSHALDEGGHALTVTWTVDGELLQTDDVSAPTDGGNTSANLSFTHAFPLGYHWVEIRVSDGTREEVSSTSVNLHDWTPPVMSISMRKTIMWPAGGDLVNVGFGVTAEDCDPDITYQVTVYSNQDDTNPPMWSPDAKWTTPDTIRLRAECASKTQGRIYLIFIRATDSMGNRSFDCKSVVVPLRNDARSIAAVNAQAETDRQFVLNNYDWYYDVVRLPGPPLSAPYYYVGEAGVPILGKKQ